jgi:hypothetical protein
MTGMRLPDRENPLAVEFLQEMANSYFAACRKMVDALEALKAFNRALASRAQGVEQTNRRVELVEDAAEKVFFVLIQREAMKLSGYEKFLEDYDVPHEVKVRLGPRRRK